MIIIITLLLFSYDFRAKMCRTQYVLSGARAVLICILLQRTVNARAATCN